jgi:hypothetical protein
MCAIGSAIVADGRTRRTGNVTSPMMAADVRDDAAPDETARRCCG